MDENTVFKPPSQQINSGGSTPPASVIPENKPVSQQVASSGSQNIPQPVMPAPIKAAPKMEPVTIGQIPKPTPSPIGPPPGGSPPPTDTAHSSFAFPLGKILKIVAGIGVIAALVFGIMTFVLPRFNGESDSNASLTYWGLWENEQVMKSLISEFEKNNPNIKVKYEKQDIKQYRERLTARIQNDTGPDIFKFHNTWLPMVSPMLVALPSDVIKKEDFQKNYYPVIQKDVVKNGAIYGIPTSIDTLSLFVNKDIFAAAGIEVPTTWDSFASTARRLTVKDEQGRIKTAGAAMGTFDNINHAPDILSLLFAQNSVDIYNMGSTTQNAVDSLDFYTSFAKDEGNVWDETLDPSLLMFVKGNLGMYFGYSWDIFTIRAGNPNLPFEVHPVPHLPDREMTVASYWVNGVSAKSKNQKASMEFMKFLATKEAQQKLFSESAKTRLFGEPYSRIDLAPSLRDNQYVYPFIQQADNAVSSFFADNTYDNGLNSQVNAYLGNAVRSVLNSDSSESAITTLSLGVSQILKQYGQ